MRVSGEEYSRRLERLSYDSILLISELMSTKEGNRRSNQIIETTEDPEETHHKLLALKKELDSRAK